VTEDNVPSREDQDCHRNEEPSSRRKSGAGTEDARQAQLEPLQEKAEQLVMEIDAVKVHLEQIGLEGGEILRPPVTVQVVEAMSAKRIQAQEQCQWIQICTKHWHK
jgi:hypothetical protein